MYGLQLLRTFDRIHDLGLADSWQSFSVIWCGRSEDLLRDYSRRNGAMARVSPRTIMRLRARLAEAAGLLPRELADQVRDIDAGIERDMHVAELLGRRSVR